MERDTTEEYNKIRYAIRSIGVIALGTMLAIHQFVHKPKMEERYRQRVNHCVEYVVDNSLATGNAQEFCNNKCVLNALEGLTEKYGIRDPNIVHQSIENVCSKNSRR